MDKQILSIRPDYKRIYSDILKRKSPVNKIQVNQLTLKENLTIFEVIELNQEIFGLPDKETQNFNQKHRAYNQSAIVKILDYQKKHNLNNTQLASHFEISRTTVAKWKKLF